MNNLNMFYNSILNINGKDYEDEIKKIVLEEREDLKTRVIQLDGFCKYLANQIEYRIKEELSGIHVYKIDLNDFGLVDHTILIAEYMTNNKIKRLLIDPSYVQFIKKDGAQLVTLNKWPGDNIDEKTIFNKIKYGLVKINHLSFNSYLNSFTDNKVNIDLENYLLESKISKII